MLRVCSRAFFVTACALVSMASAHAQITDPANDFLPTYQGIQGGDLDVISANGVLNGNNFIFSATMNAALFTTPNASNSNALYVWGINRGNGTAGFPTLAPGVLFDSVLVVTLAPGGGITVNNAAATATASGKTLTLNVPTSALTSTGFTFSNYTWNLWPRGSVTPTGAAISGNVAISDFAPDNSNVRVIVTPEPSAIAMFVTSLVTGAGFLARRRRTRK